MKRKLPGLMVCMLILQTGLWAQPKKAHDIGCRTSEVMEALYKAHPESKKEAEKHNEFTKSFDTKGLKATTYTIPVVFHVFGTSFNGYSVNDALIQDAVQRTNEDFQGITADWNQIISQFNGVKKPLNITFALAQIDPNGNPTTGINYYSTLSGFGNGSGYDSQIQQYAWDNYKYFNVYIQNDLYNDGATTNSGVCWYPDTWMSDNNLARCVYNGAYLGNNTDENFRSVLTHEFGHYLNLIHTFEGGCPDYYGCSSSGDMCCDTPPADYSHMDGATNCQGQVTNWQNFMDYTIQYAMFTINQVSRMEAALQHAARYSLWQPSNLAATGVGGGGGSDTQAPTTPTSLTANGTTQSSVSLSWNASSDNVGVSGYDVYQGTSTIVGTTSSTSFNVTGLSANTTYTFYVRAKDAAGNVSGWSNAATATTTGSTPTGYCASNSNSSTYEHIAGVQVGSFSNTSGASNYTDFTNLTINVNKGQSYNATFTPGFSSGAYAEYFKMWIDLNGDKDFVDPGELVFDAGSAQSSAVSGTISIPSSTITGTTRARVSMKYNGAPEPCQTGTTFGDGEVEDYTVNISGSASDTQAPTAPGGLTTSNITGSSVSLSWNASSDNVGVTGYDVYRGSSTVAGTTSSTSFNVTGLSANTTYTFYVRAKDAAGNVSGWSNAATATTTGTTPPPTNYCASQGSDQTYEWIAGVQIGSFSNTSGKSAYTDYTNQTVSLSAGSNVSLALTPGFRPNEPYNEAWAVWIDYNKNGSFDDAGERVFTGSGSTAISGSFTVSSSATGSTRMRVSMQYSSTPSSCGTLSYGEVEDYTVSFGAAGDVMPFETNVVVYPNPNDGNFTVVIPGGITGKVIINIFDMTGQLVFQKMIERTGEPMEIPVNIDIPAGVYAVQVIAGDQIFTKQIVVK